MNFLNVQQILHWWQLYVIIVVHVLMRGGMTQQKFLHFVMECLDMIVCEYSFKI